MLTSEPDAAPEPPAVPRWRCCAPRTLRGALPTFKSAIAWRIAYLVKSGQLQGGPLVPQQIMAMMEAGAAEAPEHAANLQQLGQLMQAAVQAQEEGEADAYSSDEEGWVADDADGGEGGSDGSEGGAGDAETPRHGSRASDLWAALEVRHVHALCFCGLRQALRRRCVTAAA